jgi:alkylation response protein AidB-like acyl-CoA dehydrogenase
MISFTPTEEQDLIRETVREFAAAELRSRARDADEASALPEEVLDASWELGLAVGAIPEAYGGAGLDRSPVTNALVLEELGHGCAALASALMTPSLFVHPLLDFGTEEQKRTYLPLFTTSRFHAGTLALHEPHFDFDPLSLRTLAEPKGSGFRITGRKRLVPLADRASHVLVVARAGARTGLADLEAFIVPRDAAGLTIEAEPEKTLGFQSLPTSSLALDDVEVPAEARLGGESGIDGRRLLASIRMGGAALALGVARAVTEYAIPYAKDRIAFGEPIAKKQSIAFMLADMHSDVEAMRWMLWQAASDLENGTDPIRSSTLAREYVSRKAMRVADDGLQIFGGHGYIRDYPIEMWFRNMRSLTVLEGTAAL